MGVAERVLNKIEAAFQMLAENPGIGHSRDDLTTDEQIRFWTVGPSLIAYRQKKGIVEILMVERGERDWEHLFKTRLGEG